MVDAPQASYFQLLANLWAELSQRQDISLIVQEILGRIWSKCFNNPPIIEEDLIKDILFLKIIFDHQQVSLRFTPPKEFTLSAQDFVNSLGCLCNVADNLTRRLWLLEVLRPTFISGFRGALLSLEHLQHSISTDDGSFNSLLGLLDHHISRWTTLEPRPEDFNHAWTKGYLEGASQDLRQTSDDHGPCGKHDKLDVPDHGGFIVSLDCSEVVKAAALCAARRCRYSHRGVMVLLDTRLFIIASFLEALNEYPVSYVSSEDSSFIGAPRSSTDASVDLNDIFEKWKTTTTALKDGVSLTRELNFHRKFLDYLERADLGPEFAINSLDTWKGWQGPDGIRSISIPPTECVGRIIEQLKHRSRIVCNRNEMIRPISSRLVQSSRSRMSFQLEESIPLSDSVSSQVETVDEIYILNCPDMHSIEARLLAMIVDASGKEAVKQKQELIHVNFECTLHLPKKPSVTRARRLSPLAAVSSFPQSTIVHSRPVEHSSRETQRDYHSRRSGFSNFPIVPALTARQSISNLNNGVIPPGHALNIGAIVQPSPPELPPPHGGNFFKQMTGSLKSSKKTTTSLKSSKKHNVFRKPTSSTDSRCLELLSAALDLEATGLVVWSEAKIRYLTLSNQTQTWKQANYLRAIQIATVSKQFYAVVNKEDDGHMLSLYDVNTGLRYGSPPTIRLEGPAYSLSFSTGNKSVRLAVGLQLKVMIFNINDEDWTRDDPQTQSLLQNTSPNQTQRPVISEPENDDIVNDQRCTFSPDNRYLIITTHFYRSGRIRVRMFDVSANSPAQRAPDVYFEKTPAISCDAQWDRGLSASPCTEIAGKIFIAICASAAHSGCPNVVALKYNYCERKWVRNYEKIWHAGLLMTKIQASISLPSEGRGFIMVNEDNHIMQVRSSNLQAHRGAEWTSERLPINLDWNRSGPEDKRRQLLVGASNAGGITFFHINQGVGWLSIYNESTRTLNKIIVDLEVAFG